MPYQSSQLVRICAILGMVMSLLCITWLAIGHNHRFTSSGNEASASDQFIDSLFHDIRSVDHAVSYIVENYDTSSPRSTLLAVHDFVSKRFYHEEYPKHSWLTNPLYRFLKIRNPNWTQDELATADEILRHTPRGACGDVSTVVVELYRALGHSAQYVDLVGHQVAEAKAGDETWMVDADYEVIAPYSIDMIRRNPQLIDDIYWKESVQRRSELKNIFQSVKAFSGYNGVPHNDPSLYRMHALVEEFKWYPPIFSFFVFFVVWIWKR